MPLATLRTNRPWACLVQCIMVFCPLMSIAQVDSTLQLKEIEVTAQRIILSDIGKHTDVLDSQALAIGQYNNLSSQLAMKTPLFVRSYGSGTLATLGIRG